MNYFLHLFTLFSIYAAVALSLNLVVGYCGLITLAHAGFFAIGSYTYAIIEVKFGLGLIPTLACSAAIAAALSLAVSLPAWRFKGDYFVVASLAVQAFVFALIQNWFEPGVPFGSFLNLTNGPFGIANIPKPTTFGIGFVSMGDLAAISGIFCVLCTVISWILTSSPWGRLLLAIRDDELAARSLGKNTRLVKIQAFGISCVMVALAGSIYASYFSYIDPSIASLDHSILMLSMLMVGGLGSLYGSLLGAGILIALPEVLRLADIPVTMAANVRLLLYGLLLILFIRVRPKGLVGKYALD